MKNQQDIPITVTFRVQEDRQKRPQMDFFVTPPVPAPGSSKPPANPSNQPLNERYTFDTVQQVAMKPEVTIRPVGGMPLRVTA